jgi:hypothetical protein
MMPAFILAISLATLLLFLVSYCRSLIAASAVQPLSAEVRDVTGIAAAASGDDYARVVQLLQLCPEMPEDRSGIRAVGAYFRMLSFVKSTFAKVAPSVGSWTDFERAQCAYFAAVALDRRIAFSRDMMAQQMDV